jgi:hypothetical protein
MLATYTAPIETVISFDEAVLLMRWALGEQLGNEPTDSVLALALAKVWLETGRGLHCWNFNWGNVKAGENYLGMFTCITLNEVLAGKTHWYSPEGELSAAPSKGGKLTGAPLRVPDGHPWTRMRAHANHYDGVDCYVDFVEHGRYRAAWQELLLGHAESYVHELKAACYFTADEGAYRRGVVALRDELLCRLRNLPAPQRVDLEWAQLVTAVPGIQFDLGALRETEHGLDFDEAA